MTEGFYPFRRTGFIVLLVAAAWLASCGGGGDGAGEGDACGPNTACRDGLICDPVSMTCVQRGSGTQVIDAPPGGGGGAVDTSLDLAPAGYTASAAAHFEFSAPGGGTATFSCSLDGGEPFVCTSPYDPILEEGTHSFSVAAEVGGVRDPSPATASFVVDLTPPETTLEGPSGDVVSSDAVFTFTSTEEGSFECAFDTEAFEPCATPYPKTGLSLGSHSLRVRAVDRAGNRDTEAPEIQLNVTGDTTLPGVVLGGTPANGVATNVATSAFTFSFDPAEPPSSTLECAFDGPTYGDCTNQSFADGNHSLAFRGRDLAGNLSAVINRSWTVDTVRPTATITGASPANGSVSNNRQWNLFFTSNEGGAVTFQCLFNGTQVESPCLGGTHVMSSDGVKTFAVRAVDAAGNVGDYTSTISYTLDTTGPQITFTQRPTSHDGPRPWTVRWTTSEVPVSFTCGYMSDHNYLPCSMDQTTGVSTGTEGRSTNYFGVVATDALGNVSSNSFQWTVN